MSQTLEEIQARWAELSDEFDKLNTDDPEYNAKARAVIKAMEDLVDRKDALKAAELAKELQEYEAQQLTEVLHKHYLLYGGVLCSCGHKHTAATLKNTRTQHAEHVAGILVAAGWKNTNPDPYLDAREQHPGEDWT